MKKKIKTLALFTTGLLVGVVVERVKSKDSKEILATVKITDLDEYKALLKSLES